MRNSSCRRFSALIAFLAFITALVNPVSSNAAYTKYPRVGDCFLHSNRDVSAEFASKNPISCSKRHNVEIYYVGVWPSSTPPWKMSDSVALDFADSICGWDGAAYYLDQDDFNYWAWFTPNKKQWSNGARWLRCDAMYISSASNEDDPSTYVFRSWTGRRL